MNSPFSLYLSHTHSLPSSLHSTHLSKSVLADRRQIVHDVFAVVDSICPISDLVGVASCRADTFSPLFDSVDVVFTSQDIPGRARVLFSESGPAGRGSPMSSPRTKSDGRGSPSSVAASTSSGSTGTIVFQGQRKALRIVLFAPPDGTNADAALTVLGGE